MKKTIFILSVIAILYTGCSKPYNCDTTVAEGEKVMLPVTFVGFLPQEINIIKVYRTNNANPGVIDTFNLTSFLWAYSAYSDKEHLTDRPQNGNTDPYYSYFNNCTLILDWQTKRDTLSNFVITKTKTTTRDKCHEDDPLVVLGTVTYMHKGKLIARDSGIVITK